MGRKRGRSSREQGTAKRLRTVDRKRTETDLDYISKEDYVIIGDFMYVRPYVFEFRMNFKPRWRNQTIYSVFCQEFKHTEKNYWTREVKEGRILAEGKPISEEAVWVDGVEVVHIVHRHESAVLATPITVARNEPGFVVVSKPPSLPIHPCGTYRRNSLQFILKAFYNTGKLLAVHRLDKETSGLVILAKDATSAAQFSAEIKQHKVQKTYLAEVHGHFPEEVSECAAPIYWDKREMRASISSEGLDAKTYFKNLSNNTAKGTSIVECKPLTGRTHQIRVHLAHLGYAIVNDPLYGTHVASEKTNLVSGNTQNPLALTVAHPSFLDDSYVNDRRRSYLACEWSKNSLLQHSRHLSCADEGRTLSCSNCPQVTNVKNVEVQHMFIHLHALKYESENWKFEVPPPAWMITDKQSETKATKQGQAKSSCAVS